MQLEDMKKETDADLTFSLTDFLLDHYVLTNINHQHSNGNSHQNLPLHQFGQSVDFAFSNLPFVKMTESFCFSPNHILFDQAIPSEFLPTVFQPPMA